MPEKEFFEKREKELLEDLTVLEKYIKNLWEILPIPLCFTSPIFVVLETGETFNQLFGYKKDEITGVSLDILFFQEGDFKKLTDKLVKERRVSDFEVVLQDKKKEDLIVLISAMVREDEKGAVVGYIFSFVDISPRRKAEEELGAKIGELQKYAETLNDSKRALLNILEDVAEERGRAEEERDRTATIIRNFVDGLLILEKERITLVNPQFKKFFDVESSDLVGKNLMEIEFHPKLALLITLIKDKGMNLTREELALEEDFILEVSAVPVMKDREETGQMIILRDITREKMIERMKTEFVSVAAHQLRTPLSAIKWIVRMLLDGDLGSMSEVQREFLEKTYQSNEKMIRLINDLLNITRIEEGRFLYEPQKEDVLKLTQKTIIHLKEAAEARGLKFVFQEPAIKPPPILIDKEKFAIVLENLLENAINYSKKGTISVSMIYSQEQHNLLFKIEDEGIGIPLEQQKRVFGRFFRASNALRTETEGTGLGLFIAKNIIEAHGGKIWFQSEENKGAAFNFTIPVRD